MRTSILHRLFVFLVIFSTFNQHFLFGQSSNDKENLDSTFLKFKLELKEVENSGTPSEVALVYMQLGSFYLASGVPTEAVEQYDKALYIVQSRKIDTLHALLNIKVGEVHFSQSNYDMAIPYFQDALEISERLGYIYGKAISNSFLGTCNEKKGDYLSALQFQKNALVFFELLNDENGIATVNENIGSIYEDLSDYKLAHDFFIKAHHILKSKGNAAEANILNNLGDTFRKRGDFYKAIEYTEQALHIAEKINDYGQLESAYKDLAKTYHLIGNHEKAYESLLNAEQFNENLKEEKNISQLNKLQTIYGIHKKETQIELLQEQQKVSEINQQLMYLTLLVMLILFGAILLYFFKRRKAELKIKEYEQRTLTAELEKKASEEKNLQREVKLKTAALSKYSLNISQKNKVLLDLSKTLRNMAERKSLDFNAKIKGLAKDIETHLNQDNEWEDFVRFFEELHPDFAKKLNTAADGTLSPAELRLAVLLRLNLSSKEIASILRITPDSVRVARYRLRKKLPVKQKDDLVNFLLTI